MRKKKGFTLIELVLSMGIIGIISVSLLSIFSTGFYNIIRAGVRTEAVTTAENELFINPQILNIDDIDIVLPIVGGGSITHTISGSYAKGIVIVNEGTPSSVKVEIKTFVPGLFKVTE